MSPHLGSSHYRTCETGRAERVSLQEALYLGHRFLSWRKEWPPDGGFYLDQEVVRHPVQRGFLVEKAVKPLVLSHIFRSFLFIVRLTVDREKVQEYSIFVDSIPCGNPGAQVGDLCERSGKIRVNPIVNGFYVSGFFVERGKESFVLRPGHHQVHIIIPRDETLVPDRAKQGSSA